MCVCVCMYKILIFLCHLFSLQVSWFREEMKFFEFVKGRKPPFKNFTMDGAIIDVSTEIHTHINKPLHTIFITVCTYLYMNTFIKYSPLVLLANGYKKHKKQTKIVEKNVENRKTRLNDY